MILVTGATGTNGREIVQQLVARDVVVRALVREDGGKADKLRALGAEIAVGDFDKPDTLDAALAGVERALSLPANTPRQVDQEAAFIAAAERAGVRHVVKFSVMNADADSSARVERWHAQGEDRLRASGIPYTVLRPNFFMQNLLWFAKTIQADGEFHLPLKDAAVSMVDVRDIAAVAAAVLTEPGHEGRTYDITGPESLTLAAAAAVLSTTAGRKVIYVAVTEEEFKQRLEKMGQTGESPDALNEIYRNVAAGRNARVADAVTRVAGRPPVAFSRFVEDHAMAFGGPGRPAEGVMR